MNQATEQVTYFAEEGQNNLPECLRLAFQTLVKYGLHRLVIFTGVGNGIQQAIDQYLSEPEYSNIQIVGVTFAQGFEVRTGKEPVKHVFPQELKKLFSDHGIPIVR